jgi:hypothetical protein
LQCKDEPPAPEYAVVVGRSAGDAIEARDDERLEELARLNPDALTGLHARMLDADQLRPAIAYRTADPATRDGLIARLRSFDGSHPDRRSAVSLLLSDLLSALAWVGDVTAQRAFARWRDERPTWAAALFVDADDYTTIAGWTLRADGSRRDLYLPRGRTLVRAAEPSGPVRVLGLGGDPCRLCANPLGTLFELDLRGDDLPVLPLSDARFAIPFCHMCSCYGTIAFRLDARGRAEWHEHNQAFPVHTDSFAPWNDHPLALGRPLANPFEYAGWVGEDVGRIGGCAGWIDDPTYPRCPDCAEHMTFVGQVEVSTGGRFYGLACFDCRTAATVYQQT